MYYTKIYRFNFYFSFLKILAKVKQLRISIVKMITVIHYTIFNVLIYTFFKKNYPNEICFFKKKI